MPPAILVVYTNAVSLDREDEFNKWYDNIHVPDVLKLPGFVGATRYRLADVQLPGSKAAQDAQRHRYLAIYEVEGDLERAAAALRAAAPMMERSSAMDVTDVRPTSLFFDEFTPRQP